LSYSDVYGLAEDKTRHEEVQDTTVTVLRASRGEEGASHSKCLEFCFFPLALKVLAFIGHVFEEATQKTGVLSYGAVIGYERRDIQGETLLKLSQVSARMISRKPNLSFL
jgi:hypothetical protein